MKLRILNQIKNEIFQLEDKIICIKICKDLWGELKTYNIQGIEAEYSDDIQGLWEIVTK